MRTTMTPKERIQLQAIIYRDLQKDDERLAEAHSQGTESWIRESFAAAKARAAVYMMVADKLEEILKDWEEDDDGR